MKNHQFILFIFDPLNHLFGFFRNENNEGKKYQKKPLPGFTKNRSSKTEYFT